jgi:hypothetical protein
MIAKRESKKGIDVFVEGTGGRRLSLRVSPESVVGKSHEQLVHDIVNSCYYRTARDINTRGFLKSEMGYSPTFSMIDGKTYIPVKPTDKVDTSKGFVGIYVCGGSTI